jgi:hypothetical protein
VAAKLTDREWIAASKMTYSTRLLIESEHMTVCSPSHNMMLAQNHEKLDFAVALTLFLAQHLRDHIELSI